MRVGCWRRFAANSDATQSCQRPSPLDARSSSSRTFLTKHTLKATTSVACVTFSCHMQQMQSQFPRMQQLRDEAVQAAEAGDFPAATAMFNAALQLCPEDALLQEQQAQCLMELEDFTAALDAAEKATSLRPDWPDAWATLARCYLNTSQLQSAHLAFSKSLALDPDQPELVCELGEVQQLAQQEVSRRVGLAGLKISEDPVGQLGPGCVIWEAGVALARMLVTLTRCSKGQQQSQQQSQHQHCSSLAGLSPPPHKSNSDNSASSGSSSCQHQHAPSSRVAAGSVTGSAVHDRASLSAAADAQVCLQQRVYFAPEVEGARVLEVGAGTGIVGITAAALGAHVTLTDLPEILPLLRKNIAANEQLIKSAGGSAHAAELDWNTIACAAGQTNSRGYSSSHVDLATADLASSTIQHQEAYDWAIGADLVYNKQQIAPVVNIIAGLLGARPPTNHPKSNAAQNAAERPTPYLCQSSASHADSAVNAAQVVCQPAAQLGFLLAHKQRHEDVDQELLESFVAAGVCVQPVASCQHQGDQGGDELRQQHKQVRVWWLTAQQQHLIMQEQRQSQQQVVQNTGGQHVQGRARGEGKEQQQQQQQPDKQQVLQRITHEEQHMQVALQQLQLKQSQQQSRKLLLLSAGLAGVGKSTVLKLLSDKLGSNSVYLDKDTINMALLQGRPYFSAYYKQHVQQQTYAIMFSIAADNMAVRDDLTVILDGQFGDKLSATYVMPYWRAIQGSRSLKELLESSSRDKDQQAQLLVDMPGDNDANEHQCSVVLMVFECDAQVQLERLRARGLERDEGKYADFKAYRACELMHIRQQLQQVGGLLDGVIRVDTSQPPELCAQKIVVDLFGAV